jgi:uncharacterized protein (DUF362 family)/NAD-dependent dihydropyrimidine dehydrogenase PreA subunit
MKSRLAILPCKTYDKLDSHFENLFQILGGVNKYISKKKKVLLKPNLLSAKNPESCVTTHPEFIKALAEFLLKNDVGVLIGDSPGGYSNIENVYEVTGIKTIAEELGVKIVKFDKARIIDGIPIAEEFFKADCIISLPKFKTHSLTVLTGAVKNCYGFLPGLYKSDCHRKFPKPDEFSKLLLKIYKITKPTLSIVDAIYAMEGEGPANGEPRNVGLIIAGEDGVSIDSILAYLMGLEPLQIPTNKIAKELNIGITDFSKMEILGIDNIDRYIMRNFKLPKASLLARIPRPLIGIAGKIIRFYPKVNKEKCITCGICVQSCPVSAIKIYNGYAKINREKCIMCLCCHELCPEGAVEVKRNYFARKMGI